MPLPLTGYRQDNLRFDSPQGQVFFFLRNVQAHSGAHPASYSKHNGFPVQGLKQSEHEFHHSNLSITEVMNK
jgi:hypothetical protein